MFKTKESERNARAVVEWENRKMLGVRTELLPCDGRVKGAACECAETGRPLLTAAQDDCPPTSFTVRRLSRCDRVSHSLVTQCFRHFAIWVY